MLFQAGERAIPIRDELRRRGVLVRDRSYEIPGCVRVTVGTREQIRAVPERTGGDLVSAVRRCWCSTWTACWWRSPNRIAKRSSRRWSISPAKRFRAMLIQDYKNQGGWNNDWALSQKICARPGRRGSRTATVVEVFQLSLSGSGHDPSRALASARRFARTAGANDSNLRFSPGALRQEAEITLNREGLRDRFLHGHRR